MAMSEKGVSGAMDVRIVGSGSETIILAHGYGGDQSSWDKILPYLDKYYRVLVFDWSFSGAIKDTNLFDPVNYSSYDGFANDLITLLDELKLKSSVFVGHSMSGMIGCIASTKRPELFKRLILVGASPRYINVDDYEGGFKDSEVDNIISNIESNYNSWASGFASLVVDASDPASVDKLVKCFQKMRPEVALSVAKTVFFSDERDTLRSVSTPCTIIQTRSDIVVPDSVAYYMQERIEGKCTVEIVDSTDGHFPHLTSPLQVVDILLRVLGL